MYSAELSSAYQRGYPLFDPQPDSTQRPVEIGDVGYIKPVHGCFVRLFNVHLEPGADGQPARDRLPDNFEPLPKGEVRRSELPGMNLFISDTVKSPEIYEHASKTLFGSSFRFSASAKCGAILVTPDPVIICLDSLSFKSFEDYVKANIRNWERFVANREKVHDKIDLQDLVLVTGVDRTTSWANVAFSDFLEAGFSLEVQFAGGTEIACRYNWRNTAKALTKFGPSIYAPNAIGSCCQKSMSQWPGLRSSQAQRDDVNEDAYMTADEGSEADFDTVTVPENGEFTDCLEPALNYILQHSDAEIAIAHNDDLATLSTENPSHKLPIGVVDDAGTFPRTDPTVQGSPLTALDLETRTSQRRATKTATRPV
ncbi:hypothetical protein PENSPDRAFT_666079 [Peniophora sp. CONT]|nr:hypothetical protein PENSPDRAFT_666079 [Peniophora sp. CONT]